MPSRRTRPTSSCCRSGSERASRKSSPDWTTTMTSFKLLTCAQMGGGKLHIFNDNSCTLF